jgi:hypothetical protein
MIYSLARPWAAQDYTTLLDLAATFCNSFVLVSRAQLSVEGNDLLGSLDPFLVSAHRAAAWPGTRLIGAETAEIRKFRLTDDSLGVLRRAASSPWDWLGPRHPEDLSFLRPSGSPWFISITHEHDGFFKLIADEKEAVETAFGNKSLILECEDQCPEEVY